MLRNLLAALALLFAVLAIPGVAYGQFPPTPAVKLAVNPLTNKAYTLNTDAGTVTVFDAAHGTTGTIPVGNGPEFIAVNPGTNRVYVDNTTDATLSVIDGATDTVIGTYGIGAEGPISIDPVSDIVYIVRLTGTGSDEVTFFDDANVNWYTIATNSFQPNAMAVDPATHTIYVTHYSTGDVRIISGAFDPNDDFPASTSIGVFSHPFAIAPNVATNKFYVITQDANGPISVIDGSDKSIVFPAVASGHAVGPQALVVNPATNKAYAAFANEVIVIDGATDALTYVPIDGASSGAIALGIDYSTNRIYAVTALGTLSVIDGDSDSVVATQSIAAGASNIAIDPITHTVYYYDGSVLGSFTDTAGGAHPVPLTATIEPLPGDTGPGTGSVTIDAASAFSPTALPVRAIYFRIDSTDGPWSAAAGSGPYTASFTGLAPGAHTVFAFATDGQDAPLATGPQSVSLLGSVASYTFTVPSPKVAASVSLASSANPSAVGQGVTFTANVSGAAGTPTGTVDFADGTTALCSGVALSAGTATCAISSFAAGSHSITASYSGDASYDAGTSSAVVQQVNVATASVALASSANPSATGQSVTFTVTVSGGSGTPTGTVTFDDGTTPLCNAVALSAGTASCAAASLAAGSHAIAASYSGDATYAAAASNPLTQTVTAPDTNPTRLGNISTRGDVLTGDNVLIGGFIIGGSTNKTVAIVATGPSLGAFGIANPLMNPAIQLVRQSDHAVIATNDDWQTDANAAQLQASGFAPPDPRESGLFVNLAPGAYTVIVSGVGNTTGVAVIGVFEVDHPETPLVNIATRGLVQGGNDVMIGGFIVNGTTPQTVAITATGPSLAAFGVANPLANPRITIVRSSDQSVVAANDDWQSDPNAAQLQAKGFAPTDPREAGLLLTLAPGAYTAIVSGAGGGTGVSVIGVFDAQ